MGWVRNVTVVTSDRADLTILGSLIAALDSDPDLEVSVLATGAHCTDCRTLQEALPAAVRRRVVGASLGSGADGAARAMAAIMASAAEAFGAGAPDLLVVAGDRMDMAPVALAAVPFNIPLLHLHGGELTLGALDDRLRHAMSKLAHVHCVATETSARRLRAMGEEDWRVYVTGAPALDGIVAQPELTAEEFGQAVGLSAVSGLRLVTVHAETNSPSPLAAAEAVVAALDALPPAPTLVTSSNFDPGGDRIADMLAGLAARRAGVVLAGTLGSRLYANAMRHAAVMIGNSSSGLIEAGLFGLPVVNVGDRQAGRERGDNVVDVPAMTDAVARAILEASGQPRKARGASPYGDGRAVDRILGVARGLPERWKVLAKKWFDCATQPSLTSTEPVER